jgi:membrane fusion protein (multidrug efflux system)
MTTDIDVGPAIARRGRNTGAGKSPAPVADEVPVARKRISRRTTIAVVAIAAIVAGAWWGWHWWTIDRFLERTDDAYVSADITAIAPRVPGFVAAVLVDDNQSVGAGDLLIRLDDRDYRAKLARAEAVIVAHEATLANINARRALQDAMIAQARAQIDATAADVARTAADANRSRRLFDTRVGSEQSFQRADADYKKALAAHEVGEAALQAAERQLVVIDTERRQELANLDQDRANRDLASLDLGFTEIRAPINGIVGNRAARLGAYATTGLQLLSLVPAHGLWIDANFKESQHGHLQPGQHAKIRADILPGQALSGTVASLAPATGARFSVLPPENATGNFTKIVQRVPVRIHLDGDVASFGRLRPGLSVVVDVDTRGPAGGPSRGD